MHSQQHNLTEFLNYNFPIVKRYIFFLSVVAFFVFAASACEKKKPWFQPGTKRAEVYKILGPPSNIDSQIVAVWALPNRKIEAGRTWRDLYKDNKIDYIVVFDEQDRSIMCLVAPSQTDIFPDTSDEGARETARRFPGALD